MKLVILRSQKSDRAKNPEDHYLQQFNTHYADRVIGNLSGQPSFCTACAADCVSCRKPYRLDLRRDIAAVIGFPDVLPYVLENPRAHLPATVPPHDILLAIHVHDQILLEFLRQCPRWGTRGVVVPLEAPDWISHAARRQAHQLCEAHGIEIAFPKPFCGFKPPEGSLLAAFRRHFRIGQPEAELEIKNGRITKVDVKASAACGGTYYIARWLVGRSLDDDLATEVISKRLHSYPCTASMERDPELADDTPLHIAGQAHNQILAPVKATTVVKDDRVLSPVGVWVQKLVSPTDNLRNIQRAKDLILDQLRERPAVTLKELRQLRNITPAALTSALLLLKTEGRIRTDGRHGRQQQTWKLAPTE